MTEKLYFISPHLKNFDATVLSCNKNSKGLYEIILDRTAFFPEGGGQASDRGFLTYNGEVIEVDSLYEADEEVIHLTKKEIPVNSTVRGEIDYELRFRRMQNHSGEHIISGIAHSLYGCNNVGFHMGSEEITLDFDLELDASQLNRIELLANEVVYKNIPFITRFPSADEIESIDFRSKKEITGRVRLVYVGDYDICACCAPHVELSGEIGIIKILGFMKYKGGVRLRILCGKDALEHYNHSLESIKGISVLLSAKQNEVFPAVERLYDELNAAKAEADEIRHAFANEKIASLQKSEGNIVLFDSILDNSSKRALANAGAALCPGICAVFTPSSNSFSYIMASQHIDLKQKCFEINSELRGRGGGSATMISGSVTVTKDEIKKYFKE